MIGNLPLPLQEEEIIRLFREYKDGNQLAREKIINHNMRLVNFIVNKNFKNFSIDVEDLESVGLSGLIKAVDYFDIEKNNKFATFATRVIYNEILMFLRGEKHKNYESLEEPIYTGNDGEELTLGDTLSDDKYDFVKTTEEMDSLKQVREFVLNLPESREKQVIIMYFGFGNKSYKQHEIATILGISQSYVARLIEKTIKKIGNELKTKGIIDKVETKKDKKNDSQNILKDNVKQSSFNKDNLEIIKNLVLSMPDSMEKQIVVMYFGFGDKSYSQQEIASILGISQSAVAYYKRKGIIKIDNMLHEKNVKGVNGGNISLSYFAKALKNEFKPKKYVNQKLSTIYELLKIADRDLVQKVIESLDEEDRILFDRRNGKDLDNPILDINWSAEDDQKFNEVLIPRMFDILKEQNDNKRGNVIDDTEKVTFIKQSDKPHKKKLSICHEPVKIDNVKDREVTDNMNDIIIGDDEFKAVKELILGEPDFTDKQALVMYLGLSDKFYKQKEIAEKFGCSTSNISYIIKQISVKLDEKIRRNNIKDKDGNYVTISSFRNFLIKQKIKPIVTETKTLISDESSKVKIEEIPKEDNIPSLEFDLQAEEKTENVTFTFDKCQGWGTYLPDLDTFLENMPITRLELFIVYLKCGLFPNGKKYTTDEIANFLNISKKDVIETVKKVLILYKQQLNSLIDNLIDEEPMNKHNL